MSELPPASDAGLNAAIEALHDYLNEVEEFGEAPIPVGHLRAILAALSAPYVPGMVEVDEDTWGDGDKRSAKLTIWPPSGYGPGVSTYFLEVSR